MLKKNKRYIASFLVLCCIVVSLYVCSKHEYEDTFTAMDTVVSLKIKGFRAKEFCLETKQLLNELESETLSRFCPDSKIGILNRDRQIEDSFLSEAISVLYDVSVKSLGKYDFTFGNVSDLWSFTDTKQIPEKEALSAAVANAGYGKVNVAEEIITLESKDFSVDLGSAGKGIALDEIKKSADKNGKIRRAVVSVGGSVLLYGSGDFSVGIKDPSGSAGEYLAVLTTEETCVSTSGSYERYFEKDGISYHHILDTATGFPVDNGIVSCTVVSANGLLSDALSTACFALGADEGSALAKEYDCLAIFVDDKNNVIIPAELSENIKITNDRYQPVIK